MVPVPAPNPGLTWVWPVWQENIYHFWQIFFYMVQFVFVYMHIFAHFPRKSKNASKVLQQSQYCQLFNWPRIKRVGSGSGTTWKVGSGLNRSGSTTLPKPNYYGPINKQGIYSALCPHAWWYHQEEVGQHCECYNMLLWKTYKPVTVHLHCK
jgi:hypothetical protein